MIQDNPRKSARHSLCFKISSMFSIFFKLIFLLEYSAMIFRYEISLVEGLHNNHQVGLYLRDLHVCVVFCVVLYNIFKFAAQFFLIQFGLKLFFGDHLSNFASLLFNLTHCLNISFYFYALLSKVSIQCSIFISQSLKNSRVFMPKCFLLIGVQRACLGQYF
ncbi:Hypothetical_protein [Hexamita inflata]|uniref:Hypothetical_protein n=1 Tax=Hexamita inflata TaxID=28002 RepID=A0AA86THQ0_9EUKA|nr:Hypothetical protein HINF_LOCUS1083 [Hexamita inflata]